MGEVYLLLSGSAVRVRGAADGRFLDDGGAAAGGDLSLPGRLLPAAGGHVNRICVHAVPQGDQHDVHRRPHRRHRHRALQPAQTNRPQSSPPRRHQPQTVSYWNNTSQFVL